MTSLSRFGIAIVLAALIGTSASAAGYTNGVSLNGYSLNGLWENGIWSNGVWSNGVWQNGVFQNGVWQNGTAGNGMTSFQLVRVIGIELPADTKTR
jgi:hypothetical protein